MTLEYIRTLTGTELLYVVGGNLFTVFSFIGILIYAMYSADEYAELQKEQEKIIEGKENN